MEARQEFELAGLGRCITGRDGELDSYPVREQSPGVSIDRSSFSKAF